MKFVGICLTQYFVVIFLGIYQLYELLSCLLKMEILYWVSKYEHVVYYSSRVIVTTLYFTAFISLSLFKQGMFAIVHSFVLLRDSHNILYFMSLSFIPFTLMYAGLGYYAVSIT